MPVFKFKAKSLKGKEIEGIREAQNHFELARLLKDEGYVLVDFKETGKRKKILNFSLLGSISLSEKMIFTRNLAVMIGAGLPISRSLKVLIRQAKNKRFKKILSQVSQDLSKGKSLSESLKKHKKVFSQLYVAMVRAGEKSGNLQESLKFVAEQMEKEYLLKKKIKGAMIYPIIVIVAMMGIGILMLVFVVPSLVATFEDLNVELPASTRAVIALSNFLHFHLVLFLIIVFLIIVLFVWFLRWRVTKKFIGSLIIKLPLFSSLVKKINSARTARTLSSLIGSGVEVLEALDVTSEVIQNVRYRNVLKEAKEKIQKGEPISLAFKNNPSVFPPLMAEMIEVGEETGKLAEMLLRMAVFYEEQVSEATKDMATVIEPLLMILIGIAVGFFAIAMLRPMYSLVNSL